MADRNCGFLRASKELRNGVLFVMQITKLNILYDFDETELTETEQADVASAADALVQCINRLGRVDLEYMSSLSGKSKADLIVALAGKAIFQNPAVFADADAWNEDDGWMLASQYLCGNIMEKLHVARKANLKFCCFERNIATLEKLVPNRIDVSDIHFSLGATWIPTEYYRRFIADLLKIGRKHISVIFNKEMGAYIVRVDDKKLLAESIDNNQTYGLPEMPALDIIEHSLNAKSVKVFDYRVRNNQNRKRPYVPVPNTEKTLAAQEKQLLIHERFAAWVHEDKRRKQAISDLYNDCYVGYVMKPFDGSFLDFEDLNPKVTLYPHQKNSVARMLLSEGNLMLAHSVGSGKTYEMICGAHELFRTGLSRKNLIVVPNSVLNAAVSSHHLLYPQDHILVVDPADFTPSNRNRILEKIRDEEYVAIYMAFSSFDMVVMSKRYWIEKKQRRILELRRASANASDDKEQSMLGRAADRLSEKLNEYMLEAQPCKWLTFDALGIETLFVDEAHHYKNIALETRTDNIVGLHAAGSKKCIEMFEKANCAKRLIMTTGTPLTNSLADLFIFQQYLQPEELRLRGVDRLDTWVKTFAEQETEFEIDMDARHLRLSTRFSKFHNLPELLGMFSLVCDFFDDEDKSGLPAFRGYENIVIPRSTGQELYIDALSARVDAVHMHKVSRDEDNLLKITTEGRLCALDVRLVDADLYDENETERTKADVCAERVLQLYQRYPNTCQLIFSDIGTPKAAFNVYDAVKRRLIAGGMSAAQIAFVHDAATDEARAKLFDAMNQGKISVCIGSTQKLGTGLNVQKRLIALHHMDVPWRPADLTQREGRILRQGNTCEEVFIYHYATEGTFDSFCWQVLEKKAKFLDSFLSGFVGEREAEEIDNTVLRYSEIKALCIGNPLIKRRAEIANQLSRAKIACRNRQREMRDLQELVNETPCILAEFDRSIEITQKDISRHIENSCVVSREERISFGEELMRALVVNKKHAKERLFDSYKGFEVYLPAGMAFEKPYVVIRSENGGCYEVGMNIAKPLGCSMRIDHLLEHLPDRLELLRTRRRTAEKRRFDAQENLKAGNPYQRQVEALSDKLFDLDLEIQSAHTLKDLERMLNHAA